MNPQRLNAGQSRLADFWNPTGTLGSRSGGVAAREQVSMPAQHRFRAYRQLEVTKRFQRKPVQQCREEDSIGWGEPQLSLAQLAFQHGDLMS